MWKVFDDTYENAKYIFPTKQRKVGELISVCKNDPNIIKIIIFGSSVTSSANPWSDIDVYYELKNPVNVYPSIDAVLDNWDNFNVSEDLYKEIVDKGVVVYERDIT